MKDAVITLPAYSAIICYLQNSKLLVNLSFFKQDCTFSVKVFHTSLGSISIIVCEFQFFFKGQSCLGSVLGILRRSAVNLSPLNEFCAPCFL